MVAYHAELAYDLCISPIDNVSMNPGFETCLGVWWMQLYFKNIIMNNTHMTKYIIIIYMNPYTLWCFINTHMTKHI